MNWRTHVCYFNETYRQASKIMIEMLSGRVEEVWGYAKKDDILTELRAWRDVINIFMLLALTNSCEIHQA